MEPTVEILSKPDCHLCDLAKAVIERARGVHVFRFSEVDITTDDKLHERYKNDIPVVFINGKKAFKHRLTYDALHRRLTNIAEGGNRP